LKPSGQEIPNEEDGNPFRSLGHWIGEGISVGTLASAIEQSDIYTWDRFGRFGKAFPADVAEALDLLAMQYKWEADPEAVRREDPRSPLDQCDGDWENPFARFGWAKGVTPDFDNIRQTQSEAAPKRHDRVTRKAPDAFVGAFVRLLVEIVRRDPAINIDEMPGNKSDLLAVASKFDARLDHSLSTFDSYIEGLCRFKRGSRTSGYYMERFPEYCTSNRGRLTKGNPTAA
jgi:hypothetical protein